MAPRRPDPRTVRPLAARSNQLSAETISVEVLSGALAAAHQQEGSHMARVLRALHCGDLGRLNVIMGGLIQSPDAATLPTL